MAALSTCPDEKMARRPSLLQPNVSPESELLKERLYQQYPLEALNVTEISCVGARKIDAANAILRSLKSTARNFRHTFRTSDDHRLCARPLFSLASCTLTPFTAGTSLPSYLWLG